MRFIVKTLTLFALLASIGSYGEQAPSEYQDTEETCTPAAEEFKRFAHEVNDRLAAKKNVYPVNWVCQAGDKVSKFSGIFWTPQYDPVSVEKARNLLVDSAEILLQMIAADHQLHPYLSDVQSPMKNITLHIFFVDVDQDMIATEGISVVEAADQEVCYYLDRNDKPVFSEPYATSLEMVAQHNLPWYKAILKYLY